MPARCRADSASREMRRALQWVVVHVQEYSSECDLSCSTHGCGEELVCEHLTEIEPAYLFQQSPFLQVILYDQKSQSEFKKSGKLFWKCSRNMHVACSR